MTVIFFALIAALGMAAAYKPFANLPRNLKTDSIIKIIGGTFASLSLVGASFDPTHLSIKPATVYAVQESAFQGLLVIASCPLFSSFVFENLACVSIRISSVLCLFVISFCKCFSRSLKYCWVF